MDETITAFCSAGIAESTTLLVQSTDSEVYNFIELTVARNSFSFYMQVLILL